MDSRGPRATSCTGMGPWGPRVVTSLGQGLCRNMGSLLSQPPLQLALQSSSECSCKCNADHPLKFTPGIPRKKETLRAIINIPFLIPSPPPPTHLHLCPLGAEHTHISDPEQMGPLSLVQRSLRLLETQSPACPPLLPTPHPALPLTGLTLPAPWDSPQSLLLPRS